MRQLLVALQSYSRATSDWISSHLSSPFRSIDAEQHRCVLFLLIRVLNTCGHVCLSEASSSLACLCWSSFFFISPLDDEQQCRCPIPLRTSMETGTILIDKSKNFFDRHRSSLPNKSNGISAIASISSESRPILTRHWLTFSHHWLGSEIKRYPRSIRFMFFRRVRCLT